MHRRLFLIAIPALFAKMPSARGAAVYVENGLGIAGYDPVAYFTDDRATAGRADLAAMHEGVTYRFASAANRRVFVANPGKYLPQYGGFCAYAVARGYNAVINPAAFAVVGGKLYLNYNADIAAQWARRRNSEIRRADTNGPNVMHINATYSMPRASNSCDNM